jgi:hypothetical protein
MATRYWVGGTGNWNATSTTNWSDTSGGASGASAPTSVDDVIFDANSNTGTTIFTVTVTGTSAAPAVCQDFSTGGAGGALDAVMTLTMGATAFLNCHGSMTLPAANLSMSSSGGTINFKATSTGKIVTTNGISLVNLNLNFDGVGGGWTLGSAITTTNIFVINGSFSTGASNYSVTATRLLSSYSNVRSIILNASTVILSASGANDPGLELTNSTNLTFNAGTSQINISGIQGLMRGGGNTFYNVSFTGTQGGRTLTGTNTFNNLSISPRAATGNAALFFSNNQTINGTLTGSSSFANRRITFYSTTLGTSITLKVNAASLVNAEFQDIIIDPTSATYPLTGTRIGDLGGNSGITFTAAKTVYWNLAAGGNYSATAWALSSGGAVDINNFPLVQDTAIIENTGLNTSATITMDWPWQIGNLNISTRSNAMTLAQTSSYYVYGNFTLSSSVTLSGVGTLLFSAYGSTQTITSAGVTFTQPVIILAFSGTVQLLDNLTLSSTATTTLTNGTLDLSSGNRTLSTGLFASNNSNTRSIAFGTGNITTTGSGTVWNTSTTTNFIYTGTPTVNISNNSATATTVTTGTMTEAQALNFNYTTGTYTLTDTAAVYKSVNYTGFAGTAANTAKTVYANVTYATGMTLTAGANATTFAATSGTQQITNNGKTLDFPLVFNGIGSTFAFQDALTQGSTRTFTITNGTVQLKNGVTSTVGAFGTSGTNQKFLQSTLASSQATLSQASGTVDASYLTIQDINAVGGATFNAFLNQFNIDAGNVDGWNFGISPVVGGAEYTYSMRSFTQPRRF